jgi:hypothetical membrane protein
MSSGLAPVLLTGAWLLASALQPASYDWIGQTMSQMAGQGATDPWIMTAAMLAVGACYFLTAAGLTELRPSARFLLLIAGLCSAGIATTPEPQNQPPALAHLAWTVLGGITIAVWPAVTGRRLPRRPAVLTTGWATFVTLVFLAMLGWVLVETQGGSALGLAERLTASVQTAWPFVVVVALRWRRAEQLPQRRAREPARHG